MEPDVFLNPLPGYRLSSPFGDTGSRYHYGLDIAAPIGTPVYPPGDGWRVAYVGFDRNNGGNVILEKGGIAVRMIHSDERPDLEVGQVLNRDDVAMTVGNSGISRGPHLHLEVITNYDSALLAQGTFRSQGDHLDPQQLFGRALADVAVIGPGAQNDYVQEVQDRLVGAGLLDAAQATGTYGTPTQEAVEALQERLGFSGRRLDGVFGPTTAVLAQGLWDTNVAAERPGVEPAPVGPPETSPRPQPRPEGVLVSNETAPEPPPTSAGTPPLPEAGAFTLDRPPPFARTAVGTLFGGTEGTPLGALDGEQSYAFGRALWGDSEGMRALEYLDRTLGNGSGVLIQRLAALAKHEGQGHAGRKNPDPASGYNKGMFQLGGKNTTPELTEANYDAHLQRGIAFLRERGLEVDEAAMNLADRDIIAHVGYLVARTQNAFRTPLAEDQLLRELADDSIRGEALVTLMHRRVQGGIRPIGESVRDWTDPETGLLVNLAAVAARAAETDAERRLPALPPIDRRLSPSNYDTTRGPVTSPAVALWQGVLDANRVEFGFDERITIDGVFGPQTQAATRVAQEARGLTPNGTVGPVTWSAVGGPVLAGLFDEGIVVTTTPSATEGAVDPNPTPVENVGATGRIGDAPVLAPRPEPAPETIEPAPVADASWAAQVESSIRRALTAFTDRADEVFEALLDRARTIPVTARGLVEDLQGIPEAVAETIAQGVNAVAEALGRPDVGGDPAGGDTDGRTREAPELRTPSPSPDPAPSLEERDSAIAMAPLTIDR